MQLVLSRSIFDALIAQAQKSGVFECCGYLLGKINEAENKVRAIFPMTNIHPQAKTHFAFSPQEQIKLLPHLQSLQILGIYHSHPTSAPILSKTDLDFIFFPQQSNLIISLQPEIKVASYRVAGKQIIQEKISIQ